MSSDEENGDEGIQVKHRKEKKELRAKILAMKKAAKSGNKQKQKETNAECEKLEKELEERQKAEVAAESEASKSAVEPLLAAEAENSGVEAAVPSTAGTGEGEDEVPKFYKEKKISNKEAKRQAKKKEADEKWKNAVKEDKEASKTSDRFFEMEIITKILADKHFAMAEIEPDGDCMYNAIAHQLSQNEIETNGKKLRKACSKYMRENKEDFVAFIEQETGDSEADWEKYLMGVERSAESGGVWGGELELNALSRHLKRVIEVYKTDGDRRYGEEFASESQNPIRIVYLRKVFHLGEHYNSTIPLA